MGQKSTQILVAWLLLMSSAVAQETLVASPTRQGEWTKAAVWGMYNGHECDKVTYTQAASQFPSSGGWTCHVWLVLNTEWREDFLTVNRLNWQALKNDSKVTPDTNFVQIGSADALTRQVFVGDEARTAYLAGKLPSYGSDNANWEFFAAQEGVDNRETYTKRVDFYVLQFRKHGSPEEDGEATGVVIKPNGYEDPNAFNSDLDRAFEDVESSRDSTESRRDAVRDALEGNYSTPLTPEYLISSEDDDVNWNYTIPIPYTSPVVLNMNPAIFGSAIGGANGADWGSLLVTARQGLRAFLLVVLYSLACKRVMHLLTVG